MIALAIESATESVGVALAGSDGVLAHATVSRGRRHAETIVPAVEFVCRQADVGLSEIGVIGVDVGPGLFTGMRVGIATAKAFAMACDIPMVAASSLEVLARGEDDATEIVVPVVDARKGEVFWSMYRPTGLDMDALGEPKVGSIEDLVADLMARDQDVRIVGDGARRYEREILDGYRCDVGSAVNPSAIVLAELAYSRGIRDEVVHEREVLPMYIREPDAQINWNTRQVRP